MNKQLFVRVEIEADDTETAAKLLEEAANNVRAGARSLSSESDRPGRHYTSVLCVRNR